MGQPLYFFLGMFIRNVLKLLRKLMPGYFLNIPKKLVEATFMTPSLFFCQDAKHFPDYDPGGYSYI